MNTIKKIVAACLVGAVAFSLNAQPDPGATVDESGNLVLSDGTVIAPPEGEVVDGNLVVGGNTIMAPTATVNNDGSITLGDGTVLSVPDLPKGGDFIVSWFGSDFFDYKPAVDADTNQWYFSFTFKDMFHFAVSNWFYFAEMDATIYVNPNSASKSLDGVWVYTSNLFPDQSAGTWMYIARGNDWNDLRDSDKDGVNDLGDGAAGGQTADGFIYIVNPDGYDAQGAGWFFFSEYGDGNFIKRAGANPWVKLSDPVGTPLG